MPITATVFGTAASISPTKILNTRASCSERHFKCVAEGNCVPRSWQCDGVSDCNDGSDEQGCHANRTCLEAEFKCEQGGRCIPANWRCDGDGDCADGSDEARATCGDAAPCKTREFPCSTTANGTLTCLSTSRRCATVTMVPMRRAARR
ncbi:hypothetical protein MTO96_043136 [Rhipicephalus appendiculatus]